MILGKGIRLRAVEHDDLPRFAAWLNDPEVRENLLVYAPLSLDDEQGWYEGMRKRPKDEQPLVMEIKTEDGWQAIGNIGLHDLSWRHRCAEVGLFIGEKDLWSKGYGRRFLRLMLRHAFQTLNLNRVYLHVYETNLRGIRSYEKAGFVHEGRLRQAIFSNGRYIDLLVMSALREEWHDQDESYIME